MAQTLERGKANQAADEISTQLADARAQLWMAWHGGRAHGCCITEVYDGE